MGAQLTVEVRHRLSRLDLDVSMAVQAGATLALVGPSAAGKSTTLRAIAGLFRPDRGRIAVGEQVVLDTERGVDVQGQEELHRSLARPLDEGGCVEWRPRSVRAGAT